MKFKVRNNDFHKMTDGQILVDILNSRGVEDVERFLALPPEVINDGLSLMNMNEGLELFNWHLNNNSHIHILADCDVDGSTSFAIMYNYIKRIKPNASISFSINKGKKHGLKPDWLKPYLDDHINETILLIVPDSGTNDLKEAEELISEYDLDLLVCDHHNVEADNVGTLNDEGVVLINNQENYANPDMSGAGVAYKFIKEYDKKYGYDYADDYLDLFALGNIADQIDMRSLETRRLATLGCRNIVNPFLKELVVKGSKAKTWEELDKDTIDITFLGWKVAPPLNACIRMGEEEDKLDMLKAFIGEGEPVEYQPPKPKVPSKPPVEMRTLERLKDKDKLALDIIHGMEIGEKVTWVNMEGKEAKIKKWTKKDTDETKKEKILKIIEESASILYYEKKPEVAKPDPIMVSWEWDVARRMHNIKSRQDKKSTDYMETLNKTIEEEGLDKNKAIIVDSSEVIEETTFTGLVANKLQSKYKRPCLVLRKWIIEDKESGKTEERYGGSGRNYDKFGCDNLAGTINEGGIAKASGHASAFGIDLPIDKVEELQSYLNEQFKDIEIEDVYKVDYGLKAVNLTNKKIETIGKWGKVWGNGVDKPLFAITDLVLESKDIKLIGDKRNTIRITKDLGNEIITFNLFKANEDIYNKMIGRERTRRGTGMAKRFNFTLIVEFEATEYNGKIYPVCTIIDWESKPVVEGTRRSRSRNF